MTNMGYDRSAVWFLYQHHRSSPRHGAGRAAPPEDGQRQNGKAAAPRQSKPNVPSLLRYQVNRGANLIIELSGNGPPIAYLLLMLRKQLSIPPAAAKAFLRDLRAFHEPKAKEQLAGDEIA